MARGEKISPCGIVVFYGHQVRRCVEIIPHFSLLLNAADQLAKASNGRNCKASQRFWTIRR